MDSMTIKLPARLSARVVRLARERKVSRSELIRQAIEAYSPETGDTIVDRFGHLAGAGKRLPRDLSTDKRHLKGFGE